MTGNKSSSNGQITVWITGDQCSKNNSALIAADKSNTNILMIESVERGNQLKYHKKKLVLIYSIMRHFAEELEEVGWSVDYYKESPNFKNALDEHLEKYKPEEVWFMEQSEYGANDKLKHLLGKRSIKIFPHCNFISTGVEFEKLHETPEARVTMENFYHLMRKKTGLLMENGKPIGGAWNYDKQNRQSPDENLKIKERKIFEPDKITKAIINMVNKYFADHPGECEPWIYAVTRQDALKAAKDFFEHHLDQFGPYQDAMIYGQNFINHSVLSPYINTCLLHPLELCKQAERMYLNGNVNLSSAEGYVRQLIGWREFVWRVYWRMMPEYKQRNKLKANEKLPEFFWTGETKMRCLEDSLNSTIIYGYAHHIQRLMILGNFALIAGLDPLETNNWFASMFVDGYDWVMVPNVIGMTLHADGGYVGTKPYAASANYINKMSDYCKKCFYDNRDTFGEKACPFNSLYWDFLLQHEKEFSKNQRMNMIMNGLNKKDSSWKAAICKRANELRKNNWE